MTSQLKTIALLGALSVLLIAIGAWAAPGYWWIFAAVAVAMNFVSYFYSDRIVLRMNRARPLDEREDPALHHMVAELAGRAGIPVPQVYVVEDAAPNAFATGRNPERGVVAVTTGIRRLLSDRELRGVIAHELAHIRNRDVLVASVAAMIAAAVAMIASVLRWGLIFGFGRSGDQSAGNALGAIALAIVAPIAATIIQLGISRSREYGADATGAELSGDPLALASALAKLERGSRATHFHTAGENPATASLFIVNPLSGESFSRWFSTHPPIAERVRRLEARSRGGERSGRGRRAGPAYSAHSQLSSV